MYNNSVDPTDKQVYNATLMGWTYLGEGLFEKKDMIGWFTKEAFYYE